MYSRKYCNYKYLFIQHVAFTCIQVFFFVLWKPYGSNECDYLCVYIHVYCVDIPLLFHIMEIVMVILQSSKA